MKTSNFEEQDHILGLPCEAVSCAGMSVVTQNAPDQKRPTKSDQVYLTYSLQETCEAPLTQLSLVREEILSFLHPDTAMMFHMLYSVGWDFLAVR